MVEGREPKVKVCKVFGSLDIREGEKKGIKSSGGAKSKVVFVEGGEVKKKGKEGREGAPRRHVLGCVAVLYSNVYVKFLLFFKF